MPTTVTPSQPSGFIGPGLQVHLSTDFTPFPSGGTWSLQAHPIATPLLQGWTENFFATAPQQTHRLGTQVDQNQISGPANLDLVSDANVELQAILFTSDGIAVDSGQVTAPWNTQEGIGQLVALQVSKPTSGGLTDAQAQQLLEVHSAAAPAISLDALTLEAVSNGPSDFVAAQLPNAIFGVIVRLTSIPAELNTIQADANYWRQTLAVVNIFRGSDLWVRAPIHTSNRIVPLPAEGLATTAAEDELTAWLLQLSLQVTFAPGVLGEVFLMKYP